MPVRYRYGERQEVTYTQKDLALLSPMQLRDLVIKDKKVAISCLTHFELALRRYKGLTMAAWALNKHPDLKLPSYDAGILGLSNGSGNGGIVAHIAVRDFDTAKRVLKNVQLSKSTDNAGNSVAITAAYRHRVIAEALANNLRADFLGLFTALPGLKEQVEEFIRTADLAEYKKLPDVDPVKILIFGETKEKRYKLSNNEDHLMSALRYYRMARNVATDLEVIAEANARFDSLRSSLFGSFRQ